MLADVVDAVTAAGHEPDVISTAPLDCAAPLTVDDRGLDPLVNDLLASIVTDGDGALAVVMADLPLVTPKSIERLLAPDADVVLAPGLGGGTNAFVCRHPEFRVDYHARRYVTTGRLPGTWEPALPKLTLGGSRPTSTNRATSLKCCYTATARPRTGSLTPVSVCRSQTAVSP